MRYGAAYLLASMNGSSPSVKDIEKILGSVGIDCDAALAKKVVDAMQGRKVEEVISEGMGKIGNVLVSGGGGVASAGVAAATPAAAAQPTKEEEKKQEEPEEESDDDMGFGLFD